MKIQKFIKISIQTPTLNINKLNDLHKIKFKVKINNQKLIIYNIPQNQ